MISDRNAEGSDESLVPFSMMLRFPESIHVSSVLQGRRANLMWFVLEPRSEARL